MWWLFILGWSKLKDLDLIDVTLSNPLYPSYKNSKNIYSYSLYRYFTYALVPTK